MAKSVNKVILVGNVGQDPEVKYTPSGVPVAKLSLATNERFKDGNDQWRDKTEWHSVGAWQHLGETGVECVVKGSEGSGEGEMETTHSEKRRRGEQERQTQVVAR